MHVSGADHSSSQVDNDTQPIANRTVESDASATAETGSHSDVRSDHYEQASLRQGGLSGAAFAARATASPSATAESVAETSSGSVQETSDDGGSSLWGTITGGLQSAGEAIGNAVQSVVDNGASALESIGEGISGIFHGAVHGLAEGGQSVIDGFGEIFQGNFGDGLREIGEGLFEGVVQNGADAVLIGGGKAISAVQSLLGVEPQGRELTDAEVAEMRKIYGDSIDYSKVKVKEGDAGLFTSLSQPVPRAFVLGNTIYVPPGDSPLSTHLLSHEIGHVWQYQNGGSDYLSEALYAQYFGDAYDWEKGLSEGKSWSQLDPEQQAEFLSAAYEDGYFENPDAGFIHNGVDYTAELEAALDQARNGEGAP